MADSRMRGRVKGLLGGGASPDEAPPEHMYERPDPDAQRALQVLVMAQRTADEHTAGAQHEADSIRADARATAEQIVREAQAHADGVRRDAAQAVSDARATAEQIVRDAQTHSRGAQRDAEKAISDARAAAQKIVKDAQANADKLDREARQRYEDVVGTLATKRDALQEQIDGLQQFDRDYRNRLRKFMHSQLRALGDDEPPPNGEVRLPGPVATLSASTSANE